MVQADVARRLLGVLLDNLADLRRYRETLTRSALRGQRDLQHMVLHALYVTIQASVDLALHAAADLALPQATTYQARSGASGRPVSSTPRWPSAWRGGPVSGTCSPTSTRSSTTTGCSTRCRNSTISRPSHGSWPGALVPEGGDLTSPDA